MHYICTLIWNIMIIIMPFICRVVKLTSPNLNYVIIAGALLMFLSVYINLIPTINSRAVYAQCIVRKNIMYSAISMLKQHGRNVFFYPCYFLGIIHRCTPGYTSLATCWHLVWPWPRCGECTTSSKILLQTRRWGLIRWGLFTLPLPQSHALCLYTWLLCSHNLWEC